MDLFHTVIWFLIALIVLVTVHEWGHFIVARLCGVKVLRFSIGFGTPLVKWTDKHGTEFALAGIPLGGYVKMLDEREGEVAPEELHLAFTRKSVWQRIAIAGAGPAVNFVLAVLLFWSLLWINGKLDAVPYVGEVQPNSIAAQANLERGQEIVAIDGKPTPTTRDVVLRLLDRLGESGEIEFTVRYPNAENPDLVYESDAQLDGWMRGEEEPDPLQGIGLSFYLPQEARLGKPIEGRPADQAGLKEGDLILFADNTEIETWEDWFNYIHAHPGESVTLLVRRGGQEIRKTVIPDAIVNEASGETYGQVGVAPSYIRQQKFGFVSAGVNAVKETKDSAIFILVSIKKLIFGEISAKNLSGPITIAKVAGSTASDGWVYFVQFLAWLSVSLGVLNLLPIPVLDGGHILYCLVEALKGSPVSERAQVIGYQVGLFMIVGIMLLALYNDILRL